MMTTRQAVEAGFTFEPIGDGVAGIWSFSFGDGYKLSIEPMIFGQMYVALYQNDVLLTEKVPFEPRGEGLPPDPLSAMIRKQFNEGDK